MPIPLEIDEPELPSVKWDQMEFETLERVVETVMGVWYRIAIVKAEEQFPNLQRKANQERLEAFPEFIEMKGPENGFIMFKSTLGEPKPTVIKLCYEWTAKGEVTLRQLYQQVREALGIEANVSLRLCRETPWLRFITNRCPVLEKSALRCSDARCNHLLGTILIYYMYVHLH